MSYNRFLTIILLASLVLIIGYMRSLIYLDTNPLIFHIAYLTSIVSLSLLLVRNNSGISLHTKFLLVLAWVWTLMMRIPLRVPEGVISNWPDMIYELQVINSIAAFGKISFSAPTTFAEGYVYHPMLELLITELGIISGVSCEIILKYAGPFLGLLTVAFLFGFYRSFLPEKDAIISVFLAGSCYHFLRFCAGTVHLSLALMFFTLTLYILTKNVTKYRLMMLLSIFMIVSTHHFSSIVVTLYFIIAYFATLGFGYFLREKYALVEQRILNIATLFLVMTASWLLYLAFSIFEDFMKFTETLWWILTSAKAEMEFPLIVKGPTEVPIPIRLIGDLGILLFGLTIILGFLLVLIKKPQSHKVILPFATASALIFIMDILVYLKYTEMPDLLPRGLIYLYFSAAPLSLLAIEKVSSLVSSRTCRKFLYVFMIALIVVSAVYYSYIPYYHDNTSHLNIEDVRFPLQEWRSAGLFVKNHVIQVVEVWGDRMAFSYIGGYGEIDVKVLPKGLNVTLIEWVFTFQPSDSILVLRKSMLITPYMNYHVNEKELNIIINTNAILYSSGEVIMLKRT